MNDSTIASARATEKKHSAAPAPSPTLINEGYTREQLVDAMEHIAGRISTLNHLLMVIQGTPPKEYEAAVMLDAAQAMAAYIGGIADQVSGGGIIGDFDYWCFGPDFANRGKAGAA